MLQEIKVVNEVDENGNPTGGEVTGRGIVIKWQNGPLGRGEDRKEPNGAFVEEVIQSAIQRLYFFQESKFKCRENALAITKLEEAIHWLDSRTKAREILSIEGTYSI